MSLRLCIEKTSIHTQQPFISTAKFDLKLDTPELQRAESDSREREGGIQGGLVAKWWVKLKMVMMMLTRCCLFV